MRPTSEDVNINIKLNKKSRNREVYQNREVYHITYYEKVEIKKFVYQLP